MTNSVLITGASRGIGLQFCKAYLSEGCKVVAVCRNSGEEIKSLKLLYPEQLRVEFCELSDLDQLDTLVQRLQSLELDLLINNAGVYGPIESDIGELDVDEWLEVFLVNSIIPAKLTEAFLPMLKRSDSPKVAILSSRMGSIGDNQSGGDYVYRSSKAALNAIGKSLAIDLEPEGIKVVLLHPGWVQTAMGGPNALIDVETSVHGMKKVIDGLTSEQSGRFIAYDGSHIVW